MITCLRTRRRKNDGVLYFWGDCAVPTQNLTTVRPACESESPRRRGEGWMSTTQMKHCPHDFTVFCGGGAFQVGFEDGLLNATVHGWVGMDGVENIIERQVVLHGQ